MVSPLNVDIIDCREISIDPVRLDATPAKAGVTSYTYTGIAPDDRREIAHCSRNARLSCVVPAMLFVSAIATYARKTGAKFVHHTRRDSPDVLQRKSLVKNRSTQRESRQVRSARIDPFQVLRYV